jgi:hypothetical protein
MWPSWLIEDSGIDDDEDVDPYPCFLLRNVLSAIRSIAAVRS